jgi:signal transduction histidine kinase/tetratricopeptide (TPR) repeat protein
MKSTITKRKRIVSLFFLGIVLPSLLLGYLAFRGIQNDRALLEKNRMEAHRSLAQEISQRVDELITASEAAFQEFIVRMDSGNPVELTRILKDLQTSQPLIQDVFFIQKDGSLRFVGAPLLYRFKEDLDLPRQPSPSPSVERMLQQGERAEFQAKDYGRAVALYERALNAVSDRPDQADLLRKIARVQKKSGKFSEAVETYKKIIEGHGQVQVMEGTPLGLVAGMEIGSLYLAMNDPVRALETHMDLYRELVEGKWLSEKESYRFYSDRVKESISGILSEEPSAESMESVENSFRDLKEREILEMEKTERLLLFQQNPLNDRELEALTAAKDSSNPNGRFSLNNGFYRYLVCVPKDRPAEGDVWGFLLNEDYLAGSLLPGIMKNLVLSEETGWIVRRENGDIVLTSSDSLSGPLTVKSDFVGDFPDWTLEFYQAEPRILDAFLTSRRGIYFYMFVLIAGILVFGLILTIRTLTREMELSRMKSDFVSTVSHEFKSPLTSIRQIADMLHAGRVPSDERRQKYYDVLLEQSERLSLLTENILSFAKMEEGKRGFVFEKVDLTPLLQNILSATQDRLGSAGIRLKAEIEESLSPLLADSSALTQAINNLIDNAVKYSGESKKVIVRAFNEERSVVIQVVDFGLGIQRDDMDKIFDRFYRGGDELTRTVKGSGLGLTLVKQIVEAHRGGIQVESEPGKGSVFTMTLPLDPKKG